MLFGKTCVQHCHRQLPSLGPHTPHFLLLSCQHSLTSSVAARCHTSSPSFVITGLLLHMPTPKNLSTPTVLASYRPKTLPHPILHSRSLAGAPDPYIYSAAHGTLHMGESQAPQTQRVQATYSLLTTPVLCPLVKMVPTPTKMPMPIAP